MIGLGTIVNVIAIILGGGIGLIIKGGIPEKFEKTIMNALGLAALMIGFTGALQGMIIINDDGSLSSQHIMLMIISLVIGAVVGEWIDIEKRLEYFGDWCQQRFTLANSKNDTFIEGFVTSSLLFCVGAMSIVGALEDGLNANATILYAKSMMDGISAVIFAASLGVGVLFSVIPVAIYQGGITILASFIKPFLSDAVVSQVSFVGSILILAIGFNLIFGKKIKVGNLLPAIIIPIIYQFFL